jgi:hypothetical protein
MIDSFGGVWKIVPFWDHEPSLLDDGNHRDGDVTLNSGGLTQIVARF